MESGSFPPPPHHPTYGPLLLHPPPEGGYYYPAYYASAPPPPHFYPSPPQQPYVPAPQSGQSGLPGGHGYGAGGGHHSPVANVTVVHGAAPSPGSDQSLPPPNYQTPSSGCGGVPLDPNGVPPPDPRYATPFSHHHHHHHHHHQTDPPRNEMMRKYGGHVRRDGLEEAARERQARHPERAEEYRRMECRRREGSHPQRSIEKPRDEEDNMWASHINKLNSARRRIRWQIVSILKNVRDKNLMKKTPGQEVQIELLEIEPLAGLITMGCGNEMEFFEAIQELNMSGDNPFFNLLKDMRNYGLCQLLKRKAKNRKTGELEDKVYVMDSTTVLHSSFNLTKVGE